MLDDDVIARIVTAPEAYNLTERSLLRKKLTSVWSAGLSVIQKGASDEEIGVTVAQLTTRQAEPQTLVGAAVIKARDLRAFECAFGRWFAVYSTDAPGQKRHADILGTIAGASKAQAKKIESERRLQLTAFMQDRIVFADAVAQLIPALRNAGI